LAQQAWPQYVDCSASTNGTGTQVSPFNTLASIGVLGSNATLYLKRGCECDGQITVAAGAANVTIADYGTGERPIVYGSKLVGSNQWSHVGNGVWRHNLGTNWSPFQTVNGAYDEAGNLLTKARFPNADNDESIAWMRMQEYHHVVSPSSTTLLPTASSPVPPASLVGATLVIRTSNYDFRQATIVDVLGDGSYRLTSSGQNGLGNFGGSWVPTFSGNDLVEAYDYYNWGFFLQGLPAFIDLNGEWCFVPAEGSEQAHVLLRNGSTTVAPNNVRLSVHECGVEVLRGISSATHHVNVSNIDFRQANQYGVWLRTGGFNDPLTHHVTVSGCGFRNMLQAVHDGTTYGDKQHVFTGCDATDCYKVGVNSGGDGIVCSGNSFQRIGLEAAYHTIFGDGTGLLVSGMGIEINDNSFVDVGYAGIATGGSGSVSRNYIRNAMALLNDGSSITFDGVDGLVVESNIMVQPNLLKKNLHGVATVQNVGNFPYTQREAGAMGIYYGDHLIRNTEIISNVAADANKGIYVDQTQCSENAVVRGNTLFNNKEQLAMSDLSNYNTNTYVTSGLLFAADCNEGGNGQSYGNVLGNCDGDGGQNYRATYNAVYEDNILYCLQPDQACLYQGHVWPSEASARVDFGDFAGNFYLNPYGRATHQQQVYYCVYDVTSINTDGGTDYYNRSKAIVPYCTWGWQASVEAESGSSQSPLRIPDGAFSGTAQTVIFDDCQDTGAPARWFDSANPPAAQTPVLQPAIQPYSYLRFHPDANWINRWSSPLLLGQSGSPFGTYRFTFRMRSNGISAIRLAPRYANVSYQPPYAYMELGPEWREYEVYMTFDDDPAFTNEYLLPAFQNAQRSLGGSAGDYIDLDYMRVEYLPNGAAQVEQHLTNETANHRLFYHCPLPGTEADDRNVASTNGILTVPGTTGCWSDVHGNFYAAGDEVTLDEWASIVVFRMDVPTSTLAFTNGVHTVSGNVTITANQNVAGSIVVPSGATLTIDGAHIGFAASTPSLTTNITVDPGGTLILRNGATLRNWMGCGSSPTMWDGVKVLGNGTIDDAGLVRLESGARITDAYVAVLCAETNHFLPQVNDVSGTGGIVQAENAQFMNNRFDIWMNEHTGFDPLVNGPSSFLNCGFTTTRPLAHPTSINPLAHVVLRSAQSIAFQGCTFANTNTQQDNPLLWGQGLVAYDTRVQVVPNSAGDRPRFDRLYMAVNHASWNPSRTAMVDRSDFTRCHRGFYSVATDNLRVTNCSFDVPATAMYSYGSYMYGSTGFIFDENEFVGHGNESSEAEVGAHFSHSGTESNLFYNNTFTGFAGTSSSGYSAGTIISGPNAGPTGQNGLKVKCNDYRSNSFDVAFTKAGTNPDARVGNLQGNNAQGNLEVTLPAGNTFEFDCTENAARHMHVNADANVNSITYWHHPEQPSVVQLVPACRDVALSTSAASAQYSKPLACPTSPNAGLVVMDAVDAAVSAHAELAVLEEVYGNWSDGGDYPGLKDFVLDSANSSYAVRNELMNVAPKVSASIWNNVFFDRQPALNPWHLAQALLANSPLEKSVLEMLDTLDIEPFYRELVEGGQNGEMSMHTLYQSDIEQFYGRKAELVTHAMGQVLHGMERDKASTLLAALDSLPTVSGAQRKLALQMAIGELDSARVLVDAMLAIDSANGYWRVQDLHLRLVKENTPLSTVDGADRSMLESIAYDSKDPGRPEALAWLLYLGDSLPDEMELPNTTKRLLNRHTWSNASAKAPSLLQTYPNPSNGPVYLVYTVPEGVERAELRMMDAMGRLVYSQRVAPQNGIAEIMPDQVANGMHVAILVCDGIRTGTAKLSLTR